MAQTIAYLKRVSLLGKQAHAQHQGNVENIQHLAHTLGLFPVRMVEEDAPVKKSWQEASIGQIVRQLQPGDVLLLMEFSSLGRSLTECLAIILRCLEKGVRICTVQGAWQLDGRQQSESVATAFAIVAEIESELISKRTREAMRAKQAQGVRYGRPKGSGTGQGKSKLDAHRLEIEALLAQGVSQQRIAQQYQTSEPNLHYWLKKNLLLASVNKSERE